MFPLSGAHYIESNKQHDNERFRRLGQFMYELSGTVTIASPVSIVRHEIEMAFMRALPFRIQPAAFTLLGKGVGHAIGMPDVGPVARDPTGLVPREKVEALQKLARDSFEQSVLTGCFPWDTTPQPRGRPDFSQHDKNFLAEMYDFRKRLDTDDKDLKERAIYANVMVTMLDELNEIRERHGIPFNVFEQMGIEGVTAFLEDMPSVRVNIHLRRQWLANARLQGRANDRNDWFYLGAAAAHCDVLVAEKHFAGLVNRPGLVKRATVITDLRDLPRV
ncbi:MAG: hypothetical protein AB7I36_20345 [Rhodospirillaceae bacterium]